GRHASDRANRSLVGWSANHAPSRATDRRRSEHRKKRVNTQADSHLTVPAESGPQEAFDVREQGRLLRDALRGLTPDEQQAIETAFFSELTYHEAATRLNQPLGTVKTRIRSGLEKLRHALGGTLKGL